MPSNFALITGGSSGIGAEFARQLADNGYNLLLISNQEEALSIIQKEINYAFPNVECIILYQDLATDDAAQKVYNFCLDNNLDIKILINDSGIFTFKEFLNLSQEQLSLYINLHVRTTTLLCYLFGNKMKNKKEGYILNMSSMSCWMPMPGIAMYSATKSYIRVLSRSLNLELKESGISVMVACPGGIATNLFGLSPKLQRIGVKLHALDTPKTFVNGALKRLFKHKKQYINGIINRFAIFVVGILPTRIRLIVKHKLLDP